MLKIYDKQSDVPEEEKEFFDKHYKKRADGKWEPDIEGINSIQGVLTKRDELLEKIKEIPTLKTRIAELETLDVLPEGKIAVDKKEWEEKTKALESYSELGDLETIKPKVEGFDSLKAETEATKRKELLTNGFKFAGVENIEAALDLKASDTLNLETEEKDGKTVFYRVVEKDGKTEKLLFDNAYIKEADGFKNHYNSLTGTIQKGSGGDPPPMGAPSETEEDKQRRAASSNAVRRFF